MNSDQTTETAYDALPIAADEGFPQSFRLALGGGIYRVTLYANVAESRLEAAPEDTVFELPEKEAFLVLRVVRESGEVEPHTIFQRKLVRGLEYDAEELRLRFTEMRVARRNLNGAGTHGSDVKGGVALRWASSSGTS